MSYDVITSNVSLKVSGGTRILSAAPVASASFTVPANSFFILSSVSTTNGNGINIQNGPAVPTGALASPMYLGPGTVVTFSNAGFGVSATCYLNGAEFINSPT